MKFKTKNLTLWLTIFTCCILAYYLYKETAVEKPKIIRYDEFVQSLKKGDIDEVNIAGQNINVKFKGKSSYDILYGPQQSLRLEQLLEENNVKYSYKKPEEVPWWLVILGNWAPFVILIVIWIFMAKQIQGAGTSAFSFGKSRAKLFSSSQPKATFNDVAGVDEAKEELKEVIEFLKDPKKFQKLGGRIPKGVLLLGQPGTGKTLLARAAAGEAGVPFLNISGSDFVEMFVGVGASRVRDLFDQGKKNAPCIIFIDELDAVGRHRGAGLGGGHDEREQTLNQLLVEMDGFDVNTGVILLAATNRPDVLDPALLRPGRFDRSIVVDIPDLRGREGILKVHTRNIPLAENVDLKVTAQGTPGFSGADLANLVNEAALLAARRNKQTVGVAELEEAKEKVMMGPERRSRIIGDKEKKLTAYHEAGHALVGKFSPGSEPLHKLTIIPRGRALGITFRLPKEDRYNRSRKEFLNDITFALGGRVAEELFFDDITTGASNDLEVATEIAHKMVCEYGMSSKLGLRTFGKKDREVFIGRDLLKEKNYSEETATKIDDEVSSIINKCYKRAKDILKVNMAILEKIANTLLEKEVLDGAEVDKIIDGVQKEQLKQKK